MPGTDNRVLTIDIGSTYTKGALIDRSGRAILARASTPTTVDHLPRGVAHVLHGLLPDRVAAGLDDLDGVTLDLPAHLSCSAKGGLKVAAVGLVPELTLSVARQAVCSAGGKVSGAYAFELTPDDVERIRSDGPDIILLAGGTDGGNAAYALKNARRLAEAGLEATVLFAGNRTVAPELPAMFPEGRLIVTENLMPEFGQLNIEPARMRIRDLFLRRLIEGKGLRRVIDAFGAEPKPTPRAVLELVERLAAVFPDWADTLLIDMGGATTDVYTNSEPTASDGSVILRGLPEPAVKRTVEGDLGMRVSARSVLASGGPVLETLRVEAGMEASELETWADDVSETPSRLPVTSRQAALDRILAAVCVSLSIARHAGTVEESWTPGGKVFLQRGKDLRRVRTIIGSGGYLASSDDASLYLDAIAAASPPAPDGRMPLLPEAPRIVRDRDGLLPLLGNLASPYPELAAALAGQSLVPVSTGRSRHAITQTSQGA
ncbi:MAG TPA: glutamate mutase L [Candidatus Ozemobacteraceae bacterium]|nr:glutamate mutase L [Candidatus Ozemobacteraceae bacterium]